MSQAEQPHGRQLNRLAHEFHASATAIFIRLFAGDIDRALVFLAIARSSGLLAEIASGRAGTGSQTMSIHALSTSISRSYETVRRHAKALIDDGLIEKTELGVLMPIKTFTSGPAAASFDALHDVMVRLVEDVFLLGMELPAQRCDTAYDPAIGIAMALDILLTALEFHGPRHANWTQLILVVVIGCGNARPFVYDQRAAQAFSDYATLAPQNMRAPVTAAAIARALDMQYPTVLRQIQAMIAQDMVHKRRGGFVLTNTHMMTPGVVTEHRDSAAHIKQIFDRLAAFGFAFANPARAYLVERPAPLPL